MSRIMKKSIFLAFLLVILFGVSMSATQADNSSASAAESEVQATGEAGYSNDPPYYLMNRRLTMSDLYGYNCGELRLLRNSLYAYHGYRFKSSDLYYYFSQYYWYNPRYTSESKVLSFMNKTEKYNIEMIKKRERQLGCR